MPYTESQMAEIRKIDLLTYFQRYEPDGIRKSGANEWSLVEHDSLKISNGKWHWFSRGIGGRSALDFLTKVRGMDFKSAAGVLSGTIPASMPKQAITTLDKPNAFSLPPASSTVCRTADYLLKRGIDSGIVSACIQSGIVYESANHRSCVFAGCDIHGERKYASQRSIEGREIYEARGSDKRYGFAFAPNPEAKNLIVCESAIDALSAATMVKISGVNMLEYHYLSLGGTMAAAAIQYLRDRPHIKHVNLCMDNDHAGREGSAIVRASLMSKFPEVTVEDIPPKEGKDYNEYLKIIQERKGDATYANARTGER